MEKFSRIHSFSRFLKLLLLTIAIIVGSPLLIIVFGGLLILCILYMLSGPIGLLANLIKRITPIFTKILLNLLFPVLLLVFFVLGTVLEIPFFCEKLIEYILINLYCILNPRNANFNRLGIYVLNNLKSIWKFLLINVNILNNRVKTFFCKIEKYITGDEFPTILYSFTQNYLRAIFFIVIFAIVVLSVIRIVIRKNYQTKEESPVQVKIIFVK